MLQQNLDAGLACRGGQRMHETVAGRHGGALVRRRRLAGLDQRPIHGRRVHFARNRIADGTAAELVGRLVDEHHAVGDQKLVSRRAIVGEGADHLAVIEAVIGKAVRLDDRPVGQILEHEVGRILDAPFLLIAGAAAERHVAAAADRVPAGVILRFDENDRRAAFARHDGGGKSRGARADDDDVGLAVPMNGALPRLRLSLESRGRPQPRLPPCRRRPSTGRVVSSSWSSSHRAISIRARLPRMVITMARHGRGGLRRLSPAQRAMPQDFFRAM